jgi:hypothetical protein
MLTPAIIIVIKVVDIWNLSLKYETPYTLITVKEAIERAYPNRQAIADLFLNTLLKPPKKPPSLISISSPPVLEGSHLIVAESANKDSGSTRIMKADRHPAYVSIKPLRGPPTIPDVAMLILTQPKALDLFSRGKYSPTNAITIGMTKANPNPENEKKNNIRLKLGAK